MLSAIYHICRVCKIRGGFMPQISTAQSPMWVTKTHPRRLAARQKPLNYQTRSLQRTGLLCRANTAIDGAGTISHSVLFGLYRCSEARARYCCGAPFLVAIDRKSVV